MFANEVLPSELELQRSGTTGIAKRKLQVRYDPSLLCTVNGSFVDVASAHAHSHTMTYRAVFVARAAAAQYVFVHCLPNPAAVVR